MAARGRLPASADHGGRSARRTHLHEGPSRRPDPEGPLTKAVLTGGIGSGKSTVARLLVEHGATVVEADRVGHEILEPDGAAHAEVTARWPSVVDDGVIDRRALGRIVFADQALLSELEAITHPHIRRIVEARVEAAHGPVFVEVPVPVRWLPEEWPRVVVDVPKDLRVARLLERGMDRAEIEQRMAAQPSRQQWLELADHVVDNGGSQSELEAEVEALLAAL